MIAELLHQARDMRLAHDFRFVPAEEKPPDRERHQRAATRYKKPPVPLLATLVASAVLVQITGHVHFYFTGYALLYANKASLVISSAGLK